MVDREYWRDLVKTELKRKPIVWLSGVRRAGKTFLCKSLENNSYFDCELPSVRSMLSDPEPFLKEQEGKTLVLDEIHRLNNPTEILKIAADHYPTVRIIATGSSTLQASEKFKDMLTGRKSNVWLTPMNSLDLIYFKNQNLKQRLLLGGLPPFFLSERPSERDFQEWLDSFWAKDISELFKIEKRNSFLKFIELAFSQSGSIFEATSFTAPCEVSRPTIQNYLTSLEETLLLHIIRPFSTRKKTEIISAPKIYAFDTGFVSFFKGWQQLRTQDYGYLFEHWVLNEFYSFIQRPCLQYWRDKSGHEIDFIWKIRGKDPIAIECKWTMSQYGPENLRSFRKRHPKGENILIAQDCRRSLQKVFKLDSNVMMNLKIIGPNEIRPFILDHLKE